MNKLVLLEPLILVILWGLAGPAALVALDFLSPCAFRISSLIIGGIVLLVIAKNRGEQITLWDKDLPSILIVSVFNTSIYFLLSAFAMIKLNVGRAAIVGYTMPFWTITIEFFLGSRINKYIFRSMIIGLIGIVLLVYSVSSNATFSLTGFILMLMAAVSWAVGTVLMRRIKFRNSIEVTTGWILLLGGIMLLPILLIYPTVVINRVSWSAVVGILYTIIIAVILCQTMWFSILRRTSSQKASLYLLGIPVVSTLAGYFMVDSTVSNLDILALACLLFSSAYAQIKR